MIAYKLFRQRKDGTLGSLFINKKNIIPVNKWLKAESFPTKGYAVRPGWHCLPRPYAPHLSCKNRVWCLVEIKEVTTYEVASKYGSIWYLANKLKVIKIMEDDNFIKILTALLSNPAVVNSANPKLVNISDIIKLVIAIQDELYKLR